jgi:hypothetical protein
MKNTFHTSARNQGYVVEVTVALQPNQGTIQKTGCIRPELDEGSGALFGYFFGQAKKVKKQN